jgi:hypothetical protein
MSITRENKELIKRMSRGQSEGVAEKIVLIEGQNNVLLDMYANGVTESALASIAGSPGNVRSARKVVGNGIRYQVRYVSHGGLREGTVVPGEAAQKNATPPERAGEATSDEVSMKIESDRPVSIRRSSLGYSVVLAEGSSPETFTSFDDFASRVAGLSGRSLLDTCSSISELNDSYYEEIGGSRRQVAETAKELLKENLVSITPGTYDSIMIGLREGLRAKEISALCDGLDEALASRGWRVSTFSPYSWKCTRIIGESNARKRAFRAGIPYPTSHFLAASTDAALAPSAGGASQAAQDPETTSDEGGDSILDLMNASGKEGHDSKDLAWTRARKFEADLKKALGQGPSTEENKDESYSPKPKAPTAFWFNGVTGELIETDGDNAEEDVYNDPGKFGVDEKDLLDPDDPQYEDETGEPSSVAISLAQEDGRWVLFHLSYGMLWISAKDKASALRAVRAVEKKHDLRSDVTKGVMLWLGTGVEETDPKNLDKKLTESSAGAREPHVSWMKKAKEAAFRAGVKIKTFKANDKTVYQILKDGGVLLATGSRAQIDQHLGLSEATVVVSEAALPRERYEYSEDYATWIKRVKAAAKTKGYSVTAERGRSSGVRTYVVRDSVGGLVASNASRGEIERVLNMPRSKSTVSEAVDLKLDPGADEFKALGPVISSSHEDHVVENVQVNGDHGALAMAVAQKRTCPYTDARLSEKTSVLVTATKNGSSHSTVMHGRYWDMHKDQLLKTFKAAGYSAKVVDGRVAAGISEGSDAEKESKEAEVVLEPDHEIFATLRESNDDVYKPLVKTMERGLLKGAVVQQIFCPYTGDILDIRRSVLVTVESPSGDILRSTVMTAKHWDESKDKFMSSFKKLLDEKKVVVNVLDGRDLNKRQGKKGIKEAADNGRTDGATILGVYQQLRSEKVGGWDVQPMTKSDLKNGTAGAPLTDEPFPSLQKAISWAKDQVKSGKYEEVWYEKITPAKKGVQGRRDMTKAKTDVMEVVSEIREDVSCSLDGDTIVAEADGVSARVVVRTAEDGSLYTETASVKVVGGHSFSEAQLDAFCAPMSEAKDIAAAIVSSLSEAVDKIVPGKQYWQIHDGKVYPVTMKKGTGQVKWPIEIYATEEEAREALKKTS